MAFDLNSLLGVHARALTLYGKRNELLANNLANADTPNFKARDMDFRSALAAAGAPGTTLALTTTRAMHLGAAGNADPTTAPGGLKYRVPLAPALDGNTVDPQLEQAAFAENNIHYQATLTFLNSKFRGLLTAITGQ
jgi:flagellar basal-body rod protein FlgB